MPEVQPGRRRFGKGAASDPVRPGPILWIALLTNIILATSWSQGILESTESIFGIMGCLGAYVYERTIQQQRRRIEGLERACSQAEYVSSRLLENSLDLEQIAWLTPDEKIVPFGKTVPEGSEPLWRLPGPSSRGWKRKP